MNRYFGFWALLASNAVIMGPQLLSHAAPEDRVLHKQT
jgi:hypothetical protein